MGRVTLFLALFLSSLLIATAQTHVPFVNQSISPSTGGAQRSHATADGSAASISQWTLIGPQPLIGPDGKSMTGTMARSGQVNAVAVDPRNSSGVYLGTSGGGVWKTTDGGQTWTPLTDNQPCLSIQALVLAPTNPGIVYAGTAFSNSQFDEMGAGILKSTDGGATWTQLPGPLPMGPGLVAEVWALAVSPSDGNVVLAMASSASGTAVYRSEDGGNTWSPVIAPNGAGPGQILFDPSNGSNAYATFGGVYKSADGGRTWTSASGTGSNVLPAGSYLGLAIAPSTPQTLFVGSLNSSGTQMFRTADGGQNWTPLPSSPDSQGIQVDPVNPDLIFVTSPPGGLWRSTDGGSTWTYLYAAAAPHLGMAFSTDGSLLYLGGELGAWAATDLTNSSLALTDLNSTLATQLLSGIVVHPTNPGIAFAGAEHNGVDTYSGSLQWDWTACDNGGRDGAFDFINPSNIYTLCEPPYAVLKSTDGGATFAQMTNGIDPSELASGILAMAMDPVNPQRLYFAASHVWQTTDGANTWTAISPGLAPAFTAKSWRYRESIQILFIWEIATASTSLRAPWRARAPLGPLPARACRIMWSSAPASNLTAPSLTASWPIPRAPPRHTQFTQVTSADAFSRPPTGVRPGPTSAAICPILRSMTSPSILTFPTRCISPPSRAFIPRRTAAIPGIPWARGCRMWP